MLPVWLIGVLVMITFGIVALLFYFIINFIFGFLGEAKGGSMMSTREREALEKKKRSTSYEKAHSKRKRSFFSLDRLFSKEKKCDECGVELEYREDFDSYYCPECHTYK